MTSTEPIRQVIGQRSVPLPHFSTYPTPCDIANLPQRLWLQLSGQDSYKRLRKEIREGNIEDIVLASLAYFAFDAHKQRCDDLQHQMDVPRRELKKLLNDETAAINKALHNPAWAHDVVDLWEKINIRYP
ncbi:hypothetical protein BFJ72_g14500 [Fusarium proliferatum]|uniref:Uncharacterized protein n=1 Tax=Gibberella intermedia TaxID=948311 RepID=A0A420S2F5_GIBIN|nr:hypothetical protein FPRO03_13852 [Fusarium proliferatum]RKL23433.1 hypothetical protein BFJ72_g14500 [Fusarium proliferatum]